MSADPPPEREPSVPVAPAAPAEPAGPAEPSDPARRLLARARRAAPAPRRRARRRRTEDPQWSGAGPDRRDPASIGSALDALVDEQNWAKTLVAAGLLPRWEAIVGPDVAAHCRPERLTGKELACVAESTAWATQLRLMSAQLLERITAEVGPDVVTRLTVRGPTAPDWRHGPLRVSGRGPRDTYG